MTTASPELVGIPNGLRTDRLDSPYPMYRLRRVDRPTTTITDQVARFDEREHGFLRLFAATMVPCPSASFCVSSTSTPSREP